MNVTEAGDTSKIHYDSVFDYVRSSLLNRFEFEVYRLLRVDFARVHRYLNGSSLC